MRAALTPVVVAALLLAGCGGGGGSAYPDKPSVAGPFTSDKNGVWIFRPAGAPKRVVIYFHGQGGPTETTPINHRKWIDHLVSRGAVVIYPRYELDYSPAVLLPAVTGVQRAAKRLDLEGLPVLSLGYSRGAALAVEYAALRVALSPACQVQSCWGTESVDEFVTVDNFSGRRWPVA